MAQVSVSQSLFVYVCLNSQEISVSLQSIAVHLLQNNNNLLSMNVCITDSRNSLFVHLLRTPVVLLKQLASGNRESQTGEISM